MSFTIEGLGTATPVCGISQRNATEIAHTICCETEKQHRTLSAIYRRAGVRFRYSVALETSEKCEASCERFDSVGDSSSNAVSIATKAVPKDASVTQTFFPSAVDESDLGPTTAQRTRMYERHAGSLGVVAASRALDDSPFSPEQITHLITVSCTGFSAPGLDLSVIRDCGLNPSVARTHVGFMGCHGAINGLRLAQAIAESNSDARVLLCAVELCTLHQQYGWSPDRIISNALFADGASAIVGSSRLSLDASAPKVAATGSTIVPETEELMQWRVGDHGFEMTLSPRVPAVIQETLRPWLCDWLGRQQLSLDNIGGWAIHPGGPKILQACGNALKFHDDQLRPSESVLADYGNMSSPTVLFILQRLLQPATPLPYVMLAFGPGLAIEAALIL